MHETSNEKVSREMLNLVQIIKGVSIRAWLSF